MEMVAHLRNYPKQPWDGHRCDDSEMDTGVMIRSGMGTGVMIQSVDLNPAKLLLSVKENAETFCNFSSTYVIGQHSFQHSKLTWCLCLMELWIVTLLTDL